MTACRKAAAFLLVLLVAIPLLGQARRPVPPAPTQWVTDQSGLLRAEQRSALNATLRAFEERFGAQLIVYIIPTLDGYPVEEFTVRAAHEWGVGRDKYDNGLVLFLFPEDRTARIEVGYGLEGSITDAYSGRVIRETMGPHFRENRWYEGLVAGTDRLMRQIETNEEPVGAMEEPRGGLKFTDLVFFLLIFFFFFAFIRPHRRRGGCFTPIIFPSSGVTWGGGRGGFGGGGFGGFSGGGGGFGGGGATGSW